MRRLYLAEYDVTPPLEFAPAELDWLLSRSAVAIAPAGPGQSGRWALRAKQFVGIISSGELEIRIRPKVPVGRLMFLLAYGRDAKGWLDATADLQRSEDLLEAMGHAFAYHSEQAIARGVLQGYVARDEALPTLRGRLLEGDQIRRRLGLALPLEIRYDDFSADVLENQLLRGAAEALLRVPVDSTSRRRIARLRHALGDVSPVRAGVPLPPIAFTRLNDRYRPATTLARIVLERRSLDFDEPEVAGTAFLFDMNVVFEDFVTAALREALQRFGGHVEAQHSSHLDEGRRILIKPDVTWWQGRRCLAAIDAKYKAVASFEQIPNPDVYQVFAYCTALGLRTGHLVYPTGEGEPGVHVIRNAGIEVHVHTLPLGEEPDTLLRIVNEIASRIVAASAVRKVSSLSA